MNTRNYVKDKSRVLLLTLYLLLCTFSVSAQNWNLVWREDFGVVEDTVIKDFPDPTMTVPNHCFAANLRSCAEPYQDPVTYENLCRRYECTVDERGVCGTIDDGYYGIVNSSFWAFNRFASCKMSAGHFIAGRDHTGNKNGGMLLINTGSNVGDIIYQQDVDFDLCDSKKYRFVIYAASVTNPGYDPLLANLTLRIINKKTGAVIDSLNTGDLTDWSAPDTVGYQDPQGAGDPTAVRDWDEHYIEFTANDGDKLSLQVVNNSKSGNGNDFVIDDISLLRYDDTNVPDPIISSTSLSSASSSSDACMYKASFSVPEDVLTSWKKIYDKVYFLWQNSTDDGVTWNNVMDVSGVEQREVEIEMDKSKNTIYRVIITGGSTASVAEEQALYIAANGGPKGGCAYFSISNTLTAKPEADCTYSDDLKALFKDDFGSIADNGTATSPYCKLEYLEKGLKSGNYAVTANPKNTEQNSWDGIENFADLSGDANGGMLYCRTNKDVETIYERTISGPFCKCKSFVFTFNAAVLGGWSTLKLNAEVLDDAGNTLASLPISKGNNGKDAAWAQYQLDFSPVDVNQLTLRISSTDDVTYEYGTQVVLDNISLVVCGEHVPQDSIYINNEPGNVSLTDFDCAAVPAPTINLSSMDGWKKEYPNATFVWQTSTDNGVTWTSLDKKTKEISFENEEGGTILYRAIVAENYTIANAIATGAGDDGCGIYLITNSVTLQCEAKCHFAEDLLVLWKDDFGSVPEGTRKKSANLQGHKFTSDMDVDINDGYYAVVSRVQDAGSWFAGQSGADHTGNDDGGFIVINVNPDYKGKVIYEQTLGFTTCTNTMYYFSLWAGSISKKVASGDASGVLCNLLLKILDGDSGETLAEIETGDIPNATSMTSTIPWTNYGVSFLSTGEKVKLQIIDNAGNGKKGNDLAIDDITLISCDTKAPSVELQANGDQDVEGTCGEDVTLSLPNMDEWDAYYPNSVYTLWQRSYDGGETWETMDDKGGKEVSSITVQLEKNKKKLTFERADGTQYDSVANMGVMYRAIVAGPEEDVTSQIVKQGYPDNGCYLYAISNISTLKCDCVDPVFTFTDGTKEIIKNICNDTKDSLTFEVEQTGTTNVDSLNWYQRTDSKDEWTLIEDHQTKSLQVLPADTTYYKFVAINDDCPSDSLFATVNVSKAIKLDTLATDTLCVGSAVEITAKLSDDNEGKPTTYTWNGTDGTSDTYNIASLSADEVVTLTATDGVCVSNEVSKKIYKEDEFSLTPMTKVELCAAEQVTLDANGKATKLTWYKSTDEGTTFTEVDGANEGAYTFVANESATYKVEASGVSCESKSETVDVKVTLPETMAGTIDQTDFCETGSPTINVTLENVHKLVLVSRKDSNSVFTEVESHDLDGTETSYTFPLTNLTESAQYRVQSPSGNCPSSATDVFSVYIDKPVDFTFKASDEVICQGSPVTLSVTYADNSGIPASVTFTRTDADGTVTPLTLGKTNTYADTPNQSATYDVVMTNKVCTATPTGTAAVEVEVPADLTLTASATALCVNDPLNLTLTNATGATVKWQSSTDGTTYNEFSTTDGSGILPAVGKNWYKVSSTGEKVCQSVETTPVLVTVEDSVRFTLTASETEICENTPVTLVYNLTTGNVKSAVFTKNTEAFTFTGATVTDKPEATAVYEATVTGDVCSTPVVHDVQVEVQHPATLKLTTTAANVCVNTPVNIDLTAQNAESTQWKSSTDGVTYTDLETTDGQGLLPQHNTWYKVTAKGAEACPGSESNVIAVTVEDSIRFTIAEPEPKLCEGSSLSALLTVTTGTPASITWTKDGAEVSTSALLYDRATADATYKATVVGAACPEVSKSFDLTVEPQAEIISLAVSQNKVCINSSIDLTVDQANATALIWEYKTATGDYQELSTDLTDVVSQQVTETSTFRVRTDGAEVCQNVTSNEVKVTVEDSVSVTVPADTTICPDQSVDLTATVVGTPTATMWTEKVGDGDYSVANRNSETYTAAPTSTAIYRFTAFANVCPNAIDSVVVTIEEIPELTVTASVPELCEGDEVTLSTDYDDPTSLTWLSRYKGQLVTSEFTSGVNTVTETPTQSMEYLVQLTTAHNCLTTSDPVEVIVDKQIVGLLSDTTICQGAKAKLSVVTEGGPYTYAWYNDEARTDSFSGLASVYVSPEEDTPYYVTVHNGMCSLDLNMTVKVSTIPHITTIDDYESRSMQINAEGGTGAYEFKYADADWTSSNIFDNIRFSTLYTIKVRDAIGCTSDTLYRTPTYDIEIPVSFSPDGNGDNELFNIKNIDKYPTAKIAFYDRWGKKIYEGTGADYEGWDGTYNGNPLPSTDYWYTIHIYEIYRTYTGHFTLLRSKY